MTVFHNYDSLPVATTVYHVHTDFFCPSVRAILLISFRRREKSSAPSEGLATERADKQNANIHIYLETRISYLCGCEDAFV